jgi:hypothetical protein
LPKPDGIFTESPQDTLEVLSSLLYTTTESDRSKLKPCQGRSSLYEEINSIVSLQRLNEAISMLKINKAPGDDNISNEMLIEAYKIIKIMLLNIFRLSLFRAQLRRDWQTSNQEEKPIPL